MNWSSLQPHATRAGAVKIAQDIGVQGYSGRSTAPKRVKLPKKKEPTTHYNSPASTGK